MEAMEVTVPFLELTLDAFLTTGRTTSAHMLRKMVWLEEVRHAKDIVIKRGESLLVAVETQHDLLIRQPRKVMLKNAGHFAPVARRLWPDHDNVAAAQVR